MIIYLVGKYLEAFELGKVPGSGSGLIRTFSGYKKSTRETPLGGREGRGPFVCLAEWKWKKWYMVRFLKKKINWMLRTQHVRLLLSPAFSDGIRAWNGKRSKVSFQRGECPLPPAASKHIRRESSMNSTCTGRSATYEICRPVLCRYIFRRFHEWWDHLHSESLWTVARGWRLVGRSLHVPCVMGLSEFSARGGACEGGRAAGGRAGGGRAGTCTAYQLPEPPANLLYHRIPTHGSLPQIGVAEGFVWGRWPKQLKKIL